MPVKDITKELFFIISVSLITAFMVNFFSSKGIALFGEWDTAKGVISAKSKVDFIDHDIEIRDVVTAKEIFDAGESVFVDAREREVYEEGHIKGAVSMPSQLFNELIEKFMGKYPPPTFIVTYCSGRECQDGHELAQYLIQGGYTNTKVFIDGYWKWEEEGCPVER